LKNPRSLTGQYLSGKMAIPYLKKKRTPTDKILSVSKVNKHNLRDFSVDIPVGLLTTITGVSGSGKSTLVEHVLLPLAKKSIGREDSSQGDFGEIHGFGYFDKVISVDQNPLGLTIRSSVGTYTEIVPRLRDFFSSLPEARLRGLQGKHFSSNHRAGMCTACWGLGYKRVELHFLPSVQVECTECHGLKLNPLSLEVRYMGKNLGEHLQATVNEAKITFENHPRIVRILDTLISVGLGYLRLNQEIATLSGGEAQRIKLSRELSKRSTGRTLYLMDEPTTGLHSDDIAKLLMVIQKLVQKGNTMIVIEHHPDFILSSDWVVDIGPDSGEQGGKLIFCGPPEELAFVKESRMAPYLSLRLSQKNASFKKPKTRIGPQTQ
jgi:excinuclease ABC subunit A